jgi:hypothetical protein
MEPSTPFDVSALDEINASIAKEEGVFEYATRIPPEKVTSHFIHGYVENGMPIVVTNYLDHLQLDKALFSPKFLLDNYGKLFLSGSPRDNDTLEDLGGMTLEEYLNSYWLKYEWQRIVYLVVYLLF